jgi:hypothetical protein
MPSRRLLLPAVIAALAVAAAAPALASDGPRATASARCKAFGADFAPSSGDPQKLRVRFTVAKFGRNRPVYLHYVGPNHHLKRTVRLGTARGRCGYLRTAKRRLFPFTAARGTWRLRFDTRRNYRVKARRPYVTLALSVVRA